MPSAAPWPWAIIFTRISLVVNVAVLVVVCLVLLAFGSSEPVVYSWGAPTAARGILLSVYFSILVGSVILLWLHVRCVDKSAIEHMVVALLAVQIIYKITTPATAGPANPVAISNLGISVLHITTLTLLWYSSGRRKPAGAEAPVAHAGSATEKLVEDVVPPLSK